MPGPVSDSYDPEWGTADNANRLRQALKGMYGVVSCILGRKPPMPILDLVDATELDTPITATLTERQWRLLRFALERAVEST